MKKSSKSSPFAAIASILARRRAEILSPRRQRQIALLGVAARKRKRDAKARP